VAWQDEAIPMLRILINDMDTTDLTYSDDRLEQLLVVASRYVLHDLPLDTTYTVSVYARSIDPDPTDEVTSDNTMFINMMVLKAACLTDWSTFRAKALLAGVTARCGPGSISVLQNTPGFKELLTLGPCAAYQAMIKDVLFDGGRICHAIMSPFTSNNFDPANLAGHSHGPFEFFPRSTLR
jgi:hypothetical protein